MKALLSRCFAFFTVVAMIGLAPVVASAHDHPSVIDVELGLTTTFEVKDAGSCSATVSATSSDPTLFTVTPSFDVGITVEFTVRANSTRTGTALLIVTWIGEDVGGEGPCQEVSGPVPIIVRVVSPPRPTSTANTPSAGESGDPVNTFNGELYFTEPPDLDLGGPMPLRFERYYASRMRIGFVVGQMGDNWRHNFEWRVYRNGTVLQLVTGRGKVARYIKEGTTWNLQTPGDITYGIAEDDQEILVHDPVSNLVRRFRAEGWLSEVRDRRGNGHYLTYDVDGRLTLIADASSGTPRRALRLTYDEDDQLVQVREERSGVPRRTVSFTYEHGTLESFTNPLGHITTYEVDHEHADSGLLTRILRPEGNAPWTQTYDDVGKVATQTDAYGNVMTYDYGPPTKPGKTKITLPGGGVVQYEHDAKGNLTAMVEATGRRRAFGSDAGLRRNEVETPGGAISRRTFSSEGLLTEVLDAAGGFERREYVTVPFEGFTASDLVSVEYADGSMEEFDTDAGGNVLEETDEAGQVWTRTYDSHGQQMTSKDPDGNTWTWDRNSHGDSLGLTDPTGVEVDLTLDIYDRVERTTFADGSFRTITRDLADRTLRTTDEEGRTVDRTWDRNGNLLSIEHGNGDTTTFEYDLMDRLSAIVDSFGARTVFSYDARGNLVTRTHRDGTVESVTTDAEGNVIGAEDGEGNTWEQTPSDDGDVGLLVDPLGRTTSFTRDGEGRLTGRTDAAGGTERLAYDTRGRLVLHVDGSGVATSMTRDPRGLPTEIDVGGLVRGEYVYDDRGLLLSATNGAGGTWTFAYDDAGRLLSRTDPVGAASTFAYDVRGRLLGVAYPVGIENITRDDSGIITARNYTDSTTLTFGLDARGRIATANGFSVTRDARGAVTASDGVVHGRDPRQRMTTAVLAPGRTATYTYDDRSLVTGMSDGAGGTATFTYDALGNLLTIVRSNGVTSTFEYDGAGRPTRIAEGSLSELRYLRDGGGRVLEEHRDLPLDPGLEFPVGGAMEFDAAHRATDRTYDERGNTLSGGGRTFQWDLAGRCTSLTGPGGSPSFEYDAFGLVIARDDTTFTWSWGYDRPALVRIAEEGTTTRVFFRTPDGMLLWSANAAGGDRRWYHFDTVGNTLFLTDDTGAITDTFAYGPFGEPAGRTGSHETPFTFGGRHGVMTEDDAGLYRMGRRLYDASARTFLSRDWIATDVRPMALHPYLYADGDPLRKIDPTGEFPEVSAGDALNAAGLASEILSRTGEALGKWTSAGKVLGLAGDAGGLLGALGAPLEVMNGNDRMDQVIEAFKRDGQNARDDFDDQMEWLRLRLKRREITNAEYNQRRRTYQQFLHNRQEAASDNFTTNTLINGTVTAMNIITGYVPGGGFLVNWADHYGFDRVTR